MLGPTAPNRNFAQLRIYLQMDAGDEQNGTDYCCRQCNADLASGEGYETVPNPCEEGVWIARFITLSMRGRTLHSCGGHFRRKYLIRHGTHPAHHSGAIDGRSVQFQLIRDLKRGTSWQQEK